jgi:hypothetical protein
MNNNSKLLGVVIAMQSLILAGQFVGGSGGGRMSFVQPAQAQISDPGAQRIEMIAELKDLNAKMDELIGVLESGKVQVQVTMPDDKKAESTGQ